MIDRIIRIRTAESKWSQSSAYRFTVDRLEAPALERIPRGCESTAMDPDRACERNGVLS